MDRTALRAALDALASNHLWTWHYRTSDLFSTLPTADPDRHPVQAVRALSDDQLDALLDDGDFVAGVADQLAGLGRDDGDRRQQPRHRLLLARVRHQRARAAVLGRARHPRRRPSQVGQRHRYLVGRCRPVLPARLLPPDARRWPADRADRNLRPHRFRLRRHRHRGRGPDRRSQRPAKVWRLDVGRIPLLLLDTDLPVNSEADRAITDRLYSGDQLHRLEQELVLGVGGARAVGGDRLEPGCVPLERGSRRLPHLTLLDRARAPGGATTLADGIEAVRPRVLFTTHTPVPAGIDRFPRSLIDPHLRPWADAWGDSIDTIAALGEDPHDGPECSTWPPCACTSRLAPTACRSCTVRSAAGCSRWCRAARRSRR